MYKINVEEILGTDLILRRTVPQLFMDIGEGKNILLIMDFNKVTIMSRSFASEYLFYKNESIYNIKEVNMCIFVKKMLDVVQNTNMKKNIINKKNIEKIAVL